MNVAILFWYQNNYLTFICF